MLVRFFIIHPVFNLSFIYYILHLLFSPFLLSQVSSQCNISSEVKLSAGALPCATWSQGVTWCHRPWWSPKTLHIVTSLCDDVFRHLVAFAMMMSSIGRPTSWRQEKSGNWLEYDILSRRHEFFRDDDTGGQHDVVGMMTSEDRMMLHVWWRKGAGWWGKRHGKVG